MPGGRLGGNGNMMQRGVWIFLSACIVVAIIGIFPNSPRGVMNTLEEKSEDLRGVAAVAKQWVDGAVSHFNNDPDTGPSDSPEPDTGRDGKPKNDKKNPQAPDSDQEALTESD